MHADMKLPEYKGYSARIEFDAEDEIFVGHIADIVDVIGFHAGDFESLKTTFRDTVNDYLAVLAKAAG